MRLVSNRPLFVVMLLGFVLAAGPGLAPCVAQETEPEPAEVPSPAETGSEPEVEPKVEPEPESEPEERGVTVRYRPMRIGGTNFDLGGDIYIPADEIHRGDVVSIGGNVIIDGEVTREVTVIGGSLQVSGRVGREVVTVFSSVELARGAELERGIVNVLGTLDDEGAWIDGDFVNLDLGLRMPSLRAPLGVLALLLNWGLLIRVALVFIAILLFAALVPDRIQRISDAFPKRFILAFLAGALFFIVGFPLVVTLLAVSVLGALAIPFALLAYIVLTWLGVAAIFHFVGLRLGRVVGREMSLLGATLLGFFLVVILHVLPFLAGQIWAGFTWMMLVFLITFWLVLGWFGFGMLLVTRFGAAPRTAEPVVAEPPAPPSPPSPPPPPPPETVT